MALDPTTPDNGTTPGAPGTSNWFDEHPPPTTTAASGALPYNVINGIYQQYLGRSASQEEYQNWISGAYGATDLAGISSQIAGSGEARAHGTPLIATGGGTAPAGSTLPPPGNWTQGGQPVPTLTPEELAFATAHNTSTSGTSGGSSSDGDWIDQALKAAQSTDDPVYWRRVIAADPKVAAGDQSAIAYWKDRIARGDGALAVRNGTLQRFQDNGGGTGTTGSGPFGTGGGAPPGTLTAYGVPTSPYASQPFTGGPYAPPPLPSTLQTPYTPATWQGGEFNAPAKDPALNTPYALRQWTGGTFAAPDLPPALRVGGPNTRPPETLPHFATGVQNFSGGPAVVGEQGPETVTLPPGSSVMPNPTTWSSFYAPSMTDLQNSPGFQSRLALDQQARERSAAARGSILSGGTQLELGRAAQDYASNEYNNLFGQSLAARGQNVNEYQNQFGNALAAQQQNFGQYATQAGLDLGARQQNVGEGAQTFNQALAAYNANYNVFQGGVNNALAGRQQAENEYQANVLNPSQYAYQNTYAQYLADQQRQLNDYLTNYGINRTGVQDFFNQNNAVANRGLLAATSGRPAGT